MKKTGMVRELEINAQKLRTQNRKLVNEIDNLETENQKLENQIKNLNQEKQNLLEGIETGYSSVIGLRGTSADAGKPTLIQYILETVDKNAKILDVGFGSGVYGKLLRTFNYHNIDGIDVYGDNIKELGLDKIYNNMYIENILDFDFNYYDLIILGDVLEHIELESAKNLLSRFIGENKCENIVVSIPYEYEQDELYKNPYEKHLQPEVNPEYMKKHYPYLQLIDESLIPQDERIIATYIWKKKN